MCAVGSDDVNDNDTNGFVKLIKQYHSLKRRRPATSTFSVSIRDDRSLARLFFGHGYLGFNELGFTKEEVTDTRGRIRPGNADGTQSDDSHQVWFSVCQEQGQHQALFDGKEIGEAPSQHIGRRERRGP